MRLALAGIALVALTSCDNFAPQWKGWVYPDGSALVDDIPLGMFSSLEECRVSAQSAVRHFEERSDRDGETVKADYECGYKCKEDGGLGGLNVCERTER